jgi:hypothetical protein
VPEKEGGDTYLRPTTGTGMPSKERFRRAPMGGARRALSFDRNFPFRSEQQPKLREMYFVKVSCLLFFRFLFSERLEIRSNVPGDNNAILAAGMAGLPVVADFVCRTLACWLWCDGFLGATQPTCP